MTALCGAEASHRDAILIFYEDVLLKGRMDLLHRLVARSYVPHVPRFARGLAPAAGCEALLQRLRASGPLPNEVKRIICDGDFVFTHVKYPGPVPVAGSDVFRFDEEGRVCAHWNVRQPLGRTAGDIDEWFTAAPPAPAPTPGRHGPGWCVPERRSGRVVEDEPEGVALP